MRAGLVIFACLGIPWLACGCARWTTPPESRPFQLPKPRMAADSTVLEITFVRLTQADPEFLANVWRNVDEQCVDPTRRAALAANGFRCGLVGLQLPAELRQLLPPPLPATNEAPVANAPLPFSDEQPLLQVRQLQSRTGKRSEILASEVQAEFSVLVSSGGEVRGRSYRDAQCVWAVKTRPQPDGRVRLELTPEIQHGQSRQRFTANDAAFRMVAARDQEAFEQLKIEVVASPGQTLVLGSAGPAQGLGGSFFADAQKPNSQRLLLVRMAQGGLDELTAPVEAPPPLATPVE